MKITILLSLFLTLLGIQTGAQSFQCNDKTKPQVVQKLSDYQIISSNIATITTDSAFKGKGLRFTQTSHPSNKKNRVSINSRTGLIRIDANKKDKFDVIVKARNACGVIQSSFNVIIDEEV